MTSSVLSTIRSNVPYGISAPPSPITILLLTAYMTIPYSPVDGQQEHPMRRARGSREPLPRAPARLRHRRQPGHRRPTRSWLDPSAASTARGRRLDQQSLADERGGRPYQVL